MSWPLSQDYNEAIQSPAANFSDADLKKGEAVTNALGLPVPCSGNFADVYQVRCPDGSRWAVKCFTREATGLRERYQEISTWLRQAKLPFIVDFSYLEEGIRIAGKWHPILKMQWVEGLTLNQFVSQYLDKPAMLEALLQLWAKLGKYLRAAQVGHCDLQHGNVLLVPGSTPNALALKLIDYDGMWVPALAGKKSGEVGHANYQHPQRLRDGTYSPEVDRFPLLLIATALRALSVKGKALWDKYDNGDNLLFKEADLKEPLKSLLFLDSTKVADPVVKSLVDCLVKGLRQGLAFVPTLEELISEAAPLPPPQSEGVRSASSGPSPPVTPLIVPSTTPSDAPIKAWYSDASSREALADAPRRVGKRTHGDGVPFGAWILAGVALFGLIGAVGIFFLLTKNGGENHKIEESQDGEHLGHQVTAAPAGNSQEKDIAKRPEARPTIGAKPKPRPPDADAQAAAHERIRAVYKAQYDRIRPEDQRALAVKFLQDGVAVKDDPAVQFVLLREARDLAARANELVLAQYACGELSSRFAVTDLDMKAAAFELADHTASTPAAHLNAGEAALIVVEVVEEDGDYESADRFLKIAQGAARSAAIPSFETWVGRHARELEGLRQAWPPAKEAAQSLVADPGDSTANLVLGKFRCLQKGDWDAGLSMLVLGSNPDWKDLTKKDLASPADGAARAELGDKYKTLADTEIGTAKVNLLCRACGWYEQAESGLSGLPRTEASKKVAQIERDLPPLRAWIIDSAYGAANGWAPVTSGLRASLLSKMGQELPVIADAGALHIADPIRSQPKSLIVMYRHRGWLRLSITGQGGTTAIPAATGFLDGAPGRPKPGQELVILYGRYGAYNSWADVTAQLQEQVEGQTLTVNPASLRLPNSAFGKNKALVIVYRSGDAVRLSVTAAAASTYLAPSVPAKP